MEELKPCPFCGSTKLKLEKKNGKVLWTMADGRCQRKTYSIRCNKCHARGGAVGGVTSREKTFPKDVVSEKELEKRAIEAWNTRQ